MKRTEVLRRLRAHRPLALPPAGARAAVLVPLVCGADEQLDVLLTRRADGLGAHAGQVAFPGGRVDPDDPSPEAAALREAFEELGIAPASVEVVGQLDELYTVTGFHVSPVVGVIPAGLELVPNPREVARVFSVPLVELLRRDRWLARRHRYGGSEFLVWHFPFDGEDVWGATASVLRGFVELLWAEP